MKKLYKLLLLNSLLFIFVCEKSFSQVNLIPNGDYESGGTTSCHYNCTNWGNYQISDWIQTAGSFDWFDWDWRSTNCTPWAPGEPTTKLSNRCVGFYGMKSGSYCYSVTTAQCSYLNNINESMMVKLKHKLRIGRTYKFKTKLYFNSAGGQNPTSDIKIFIRLSTSTNWCNTSGGGYPNGIPNNNVKFSIPISIDHTKLNQWIDIEANIVVPDEFDNMVEYLIIQGDADNQQSYIFLDDTKLYSCCESYCTPANFSNPIVFVSGSAPQDKDLCIVNNSPWFFKVKNAIDIKFLVFNSWGGEFFYTHEKNANGLIDSGQDYYQFMWNGYNNNGNAPQQQTVFNYLLKITNCFNGYVYTYIGLITVFPDPYENPTIIIPYYSSDECDENCCEDYKYYQNIEFSGNFRKDVDNFIIAGENVTTGTTGPVVIKSGANVKFNAGNYITFEPGFSVESGATFKAEIANCAEIIDKMSSNKWLLFNNANDIVLNKNSTIDNSENLFFSVYPNPNDGNMTVEYEITLKETGVLEIYNIVGQKLLSFPLKGGNNTFSISATSLNDGIYYYRAVVEGNQISGERFLIIK